MEPGAAETEKWARIVCKRRTNKNTKFHISVKDLSVWVLVQFEKSFVSGYAFRHAKVQKSSPALAAVQYRQDSAAKAGRTCGLSGIASAMP